MMGSVSLRSMAVVGCLLLGFMGSARAGDPDLAKFLLQHGQAALSKGEYDDALTKLRKAREEDPKLIEATYVIALVLERKRDLPKAIVEYRTFKLSAEAAEREGALSKRLAKILKKALVRLKALDAGNTALNKVQAAFADRMCVAARAVAARDPSLTHRMLKVARGAAPDHPETRNLLDEMESGFTPLPSEFDGVHDWLDLIKGKMFGTNEGWTYTDTKIAISALRGSVARPPGGYESGPRYAITADFGLREIPSLEKTTTAGLLFGLVDGQGFGAMLFHDEGKSDRLALVMVSLNPPKDRPLEVVDIPTWTLDKTHRVSVLVQGAKVKVYFDNVLAISLKVPGHKDLNGTIGVSLQNTTLDIKQFRVGKVVGGAK